METTGQLPRTERTEIPQQPTISLIRLFRFSLFTGEILWGGAVNAYLFLHLLCYDCFPMLAQSNHASPWILLASVIGIIIAIVFRSPWQLIAWLLPGAVVFALWNGGTWLPASSQEAEGVEVTVATFNVHGRRRTFRNYDTLDIIKELDADIIGMQEVSFTFASQLNTDLKDQYPYQATRLTRGNEFALISRYPIIDYEFHFEDFDRENDLSIPGYLRAVIDIEGQLIVVYVMHPPNPSMDPFTEYDDRDLNAQITYVADLADQEENPTILLCDCNTSPTSRQYQYLNDRFSNAFAAQGWGFGMTYPSSFPVLRIDHVWYSETDFKTLDVQVWDDSGSSDHRPLWARLDLLVSQ